jgi:hypothetical protein
MKKYRTNAGTVEEKLPGVNATVNPSEKVQIAMAGGADTLKDVQTILGQEGKRNNLKGQGAKHLVSFQYDDYTGEGGYTGPGSPAAISEDTGPDYTGEGDWTLPDDPTGGGPSGGPSGGLLDPFKTPGSPWTTPLKDVKRDVPTYTIPSLNYPQNLTPEEEFDDKSEAVKSPLTKEEKPESRFSTRPDTSFPNPFSATAKLFGLEPPGPGISKEAQVHYDVAFGRPTQEYVDTDALLAEAARQERELTKPPGGDSGDDAPKKKKKKPISYADNKVTLDVKSPTRAQERYRGGWTFA